MEALDCIFTRHSVRSFQQKRIPMGDLETILRAAVAAPTAMNRQDWHFTAICNHDVLSRLAEAVRAAQGREKYDFYKPDVLVVASCLRESRFGAPDCACALQNIFLAANALGIGSVWINQLCDCCNDENVRRILNEAGVPDSDDVFGCAALGYPDGEIIAREKRTDVIKICK